MSVTGPSFNINAINKLAEVELQHGLIGDSSWHHQYKDSCYVFIGGLPYGLNEGDLAVVFSQWGEPIDIHLVRDKKTGTSKGFAFIGYEDQRSTNLAVDNFNGYELLGRRLRVDHCRNFRSPKPKDSETQGEYKPSGAEGKGYKVYGVTESAKYVMESAKPSQAQGFTLTGHQGLKDAEEQWAEEFELELKKEKKKEKKQKKEQERSKDNQINFKRAQISDDRRRHSPEQRHCSISERKDSKDHGEYGYRNYENGSRKPSDDQRWSRSNKQYPKPH